MASTLIIMKETKLVECGRVAFIASGPYTGKLAVIVEIIDQNRVLIDGPIDAVPRHPTNMKSIHLTKFVIHLPHGSRSRVVRKEWEKADMTNKWSATTWCQKLKNKAIKASLSDFERFQVREIKKQRSLVIRRAFNKMKIAAKTA